MKREIHTTAAKEHLRVAEEYNAKTQTEKDENKRIAFRTVASHNYFYAGTNAIEATLAGKDTHSFNHENRNRNMMENPELFDDELYSLYNEVERDLRNKVAYRGNNGKMYEKLKRFAAKANGDV